MLQPQRRQLPRPPPLRRSMQLRRQPNRPPRLQMQQIELLPAQA
jgi:hypothetical protein